MSDVKKNIGYLSRQKLALLSAKLKERTVKAPQQEIGRRPNRFAPCPLSFAQQRLWFLDQLAPNNPFYNIPEAVRLDGKLDLKVLERVINEIVRRHEALRTRIEMGEREPVQVIEEWEYRELWVENLTSLTQQEREEEIMKAMREEAGTGFDLSRGPLLRVKVLKVAEEQHVVLFTMHHIISDAWSMGVLMREVCALYEGYGAGNESPLPEVGIQYADYAIWQRECLAGGVLEREVRYWKERLRGMAIIELPTDHPRPPSPSYRGGQVGIGIGRESSEGLQSLSQQEGVTLFMALMAAFKVVLMRYSGEEDVGVGTVVANRTRNEVEGVIGFFVNTLVLRTDLGGNPTFKELIRREREVVLDAFAHQEAPFEKLVEEINPDRDLSRSPLFQVMMTLQNMGGEKLKIKGLKVSGIGEGSGTAKFDLTLALAEGRGVIAGSLGYSHDLYEGETIRRMARHYEKVVVEIIRNSEQRIREIELLSEAERKQLLEEWNHWESKPVTEATIPELFERRQQRVGDRVAVSYEEQELTYRELNERANRVAHYLRRLGVGPEVTVGICVGRCLELVVGVLGVLKAGGTYLPLDPGYPAERLRYMLEDARPLVLLTEQRRLVSLPDFEGKTVCLDRDWSLLEIESGANPERELRGENLAYVIYTSGSTGRPKGVGITHQSAAGLIQWTGENFSAEELGGALASTSLCFDLSVFELFGPLCLGGKVILVEDAMGLLGSVRAGEVRLINTVPSAMRELARFEEAPLKGRTVNLAGEALSGELVETLYGLGVRKVYNLYGPSEDTTYSTGEEVDTAVGQLVMIGRPLSGKRAYILDRGDELTPVGVRGELYIGGGGLARGYLRRPDLTADRFIPHQFSRKGGERLYRTGDVCRYRSNGKIEFVRRIDEQVKIRGYRIELGEVEAALNEHRLVKQSAVVAKADERHGKRLLGYVVGEAATTPADLKRHLRERLPEYMIPETITILEEMPATANGKVDRKQLLSLSNARQSAEGAYVAPRDVLELRLAQVWENVLGIHPISVTSNFFDLGGHSLLAVRVMAGIRNVVGRQLPLSALFQGGAIESLAAILRRDVGAMPLSCLVELQPLGSRPPLFFAHPAGGNVLCYLDLARCLGLDQPFYGFQTPGLYGERPLYTRIEDLAAHYVETLKAARHEGPYVLGGWSIGGSIAFEMAQQLVAQGQQVSQLLLLDTGAPIPGKETIEVEDEKIDSEDDVALLVRSFSETLPISSEELEPLQGDERVDYILRKAVSANLLPPDVEISQARSFLNVYRTNVRAANRYTPRVYPGAVTLFKVPKPPIPPPSDESATSEEINKSVQDPTMGWGELAAGGVRIIDAPGKHVTMVSKPHVETLAIQIKACLEKC
jgi:amino acid adenylation domain-containing protein